jgi:hypothetical protein
MNNLYEIQLDRLRIGHSALEHTHSYTPPTRQVSQKKIRQSIKKRTADVSLLEAPAFNSGRALFPGSADHYVDEPVRALSDKPAPQK